VPAITEHAMRAFLADPVVSHALGATAAKNVTEKLHQAAGAPGALFGDEVKRKAMVAARKLLDAAAAPHESARHAAALGVGSSGARGAFADILDSLIVLLAERMRAALHDGNERRAIAVSRASDLVGEARIRASGNVNPQLLTANLLRDIGAALK
jgi:DNA polymerase-3 subunit delta'